MLDALAAVDVAGGAEAAADTEVVGDTELAADAAVDADKLGAPLAFTEAGAFGELAAVLVELAGEGLTEPALALPLLTGALPLGPATVVV